MAAKIRKEVIIKNFPNDTELGEYIRKKYTTIVGNLNEYKELIRKFPNDTDLGKHFRKISV